MEYDIFDTWDAPEVSEERWELSWQEHQAGIEYAIYLDSKMS